MRVPAADVDKRDVELVSHQRAHAARLELEPFRGERIPVGGLHLARHAAGRTLAEILAWPDAELEAVHDYIQWVFPLTQPSGVNPSAPLVTAGTVGAFVEDRALRERLRAALDRMLAFYGLRRVVITDGDVRVQIDEPRFAARSATWLRPGNHNHLRLTRIMGSLSALGLPDEARGLQRCLTIDVAGGPGAGRITPQTLRFWLAAVER